MAFPGLYNEITHVPTDLLRTYCRIYVPMVPTVSTVRARTIPSAVQYVLGSAVRAYCIADVRTYIC